MAGALLLDTFSLFFRAFFALPAMSTRLGEPTNALYGFSALLLKLMREHPGAQLCFAVDTGRGTFRHQAFAGYKAQRAPAPTPLIEQLKRLEQLLSALGAPVLRSPGFEADDVLASVAHARRQQALPTLVVSGDRDLLQLAHGSVRTLFVGQRGKDALIYDEAAVLARFGVVSCRLPSYMALVGDVSDNLPGVPGIGPSTAARLLQGKQNCEELLASLAEVKPERVRLALGAHTEQIRLNEQLARLRIDAPLGEPPHSGVPSRAGLEALRALFEELEFRSLLSRLDKLLTPGAASGTELAS